MSERTGLGSRYWKLWSASVVSNLGDGVGRVAYPWLASAVTRNPLLIALIGVVQRVPWLLFALPAGVVTDRVDRRKLILWMDVIRFATTTLVAVVVLAGQGSLPDPAAVAEGDFRTGPEAYLVLLYASALIFGFAEVLRDNAAQTILPAVVRTDQLERANGTLWGAETVTNDFLGPPLGGVLIAVAFSLPFFFDAATFALAVVLVALIAGSFSPAGAGRAAAGEAGWRGEIAEGFGWLWRHPLLRSLAVILGLINGLAMMGFSVLVLYAQEILEVGPELFGILGSAGAVGGVIGAFTASRISRAVGSGNALRMTLAGESASALLIGVTSFFVVAYGALVLAAFLAVLWNVITVSLRQSIIPDQLLGRVNSVYRFFGWGMMPIGAALGGAMVWVFERMGDRSLALRMPFIVAAAAYVLLFVYAAPKLTTQRIEQARAGAGRSAE